MEVSYFVGLGPDLDLTGFGWATSEIQGFLRFGGKGAAFGRNDGVWVASSPSLGEVMTDLRRSWLVLSLDEVGGQSFEWVGGGGEGLECGECVGDQLFGVLQGLLNTEDGGPGGFDAGGVFAGGFA